MVMFPVYKTNTRRVLAPVTGVVTAFPFMVVLLFTLKDFDAVLTSGAGPLLEIYYQVTKSRTGVSTLALTQG